MAMPAALTHLLTDTVQVAPRTGTTSYGEASYGPPQSYPARVVRRTRMVRTPDGEERLSAVTVYLADDYGITPDAQLTLPDGTQPPLLNTASYPHPTYGRYQELYA